MISKLTKHWRISRILEEIPDSIELFLEYDLDCYSCSASDSERLNDGLLSHGYSAEEIEDFVAKLQRLLEKKNSAELEPVDVSDYECKVLENGLGVAGLIITNTAIEAINQLNVDSKKYFKIKISAGGCSGYSYQYDYLDSLDSNDVEFNMTENLTLVLDLYSYHKLKGSTLEFKFALQDSGLKIINPNSKTECHCGKSVGF